MRPGNEAWERGYKILITASNPRLSKGALGGEMKSLTGTGGLDTAERGTGSSSWFSLHTNRRQFGIHLLLYCSR